MSDSGNSQLKQLEWFKARVEEAWKGPFQQVATTRRTFFDKIVVLSGGTIALSINLLGSFASKEIVPRSKLLLEFSWVFLALSLLLALTRNWFEQELSIVLLGERLLEDAKQAFPSSVPNSEELVKGVDGKRGWLSHLVQKAGLCSLITLMAGYALLIMFAILNVNAFASASRSH